jgi:quercetin dioxygenase-like cupin family protein
MNPNTYIEQLRDEGFSDVQIHEMEEGFNAGEHVHDEHTVHIILKGGLEITDETGTKIYDEGDRVEFPAGTKHSAKSASAPFSMIVGVKK